MSIVLGIVVSKVVLFNELKSCPSNALDESFEYVKAPDVIICATPGPPIDLTVK
jgi:hypothetical protein